MTYLELCRDLVAEVGIAGGTGPPSVTGQTGEFANVVRWIRDANLYIDNLWRDWRYLWTEYDVNITTASPPMPSLPANPVCREWNRDSFWTRYGTAASRQLKYMEWSMFRVQHTGGVTTGEPTVFTVKPDNTIALNCIPTNSTPMHAEYWRRPVRLVANDDVPLLPEDYHRLIICRAAVMYGNREAAGEIISGMEAEYIDGLEKLESDQIEAFRNSRMGGQDISLQMEPQ